MAREIQLRGPGAGRTLYYTIHNQTSGYVWSTSGGTGGFETFISGDWTDYAVSLTEQGVSNFYAGNLPSALPAGLYSIDARQQMGGSPAQTDPGVANGDVNWNGSINVPLSDLVTSGQFAQVVPIKLARGCMVQNFGLYFKSSTDHVTPFTSGIVSGQIARDGGSFTALQSGAYTETGLGFYNLQALTSGDLNCGTAKLLFTAAGISGYTADPLPFSFVLQRVSGSV